MNPESVKYTVSLTLNLNTPDPLAAVEAFMRATREEGRTLTYRVQRKGQDRYLDVKNAVPGYDDLIAQKDAAYAERNRLVAALSKLFPASIEQHQGEDWEDDWRNVIFIDLPTGSVSWHIHDSELPLFEHLARNQGRSWDGHDNEEKYRRLAALEPHGD